MDQKQLEIRGPKVSIITIVYNNVQDIRFTLESVARQSYTNIEYIVIDGASSDGTFDLVQSYAGVVTNMLSEPDNGIYDAMNKGLARATGDYVLFLNSGDELFEAETLAYIFSREDDADIYYGETKLIDSQRHIIGDRRHRAPKEFTWKSFRYGMNVCHQAIYIRRSLVEPYDTRYELSSDIDWIIRAAKRAQKIVNVEHYVAKYLVGGMSQTHLKRSLKERYEIFKTYYGFLPNLFNHFIIALRLVVHKIRYGKTRD
ncbi:MAG: glycosyltransferase family 2 protein [Sphingobacterium sp.]